MNAREKRSWIFMRISGIVLVILLLVQVLTTNVLNAGGPDTVSLASRWSNPVWRFWDLAVLWLAMLHGCNGLVAITRYRARGDRTRRWMRVAVLVVTAAALVLGTLAIFVFDPGPV